MTEKEATAPVSAIDILAEFVLAVGVSDFVLDLVKNYLDRKVVSDHDWLLVISGAAPDVDMDALTRLAREEIVRERSSNHKQATVQ